MKTFMNRTHMDIRMMQTQRDTFHQPFWDQNKMPRTPQGTKKPIDFIQRNPKFGSSHSSFRRISYGERNVNNPS